jgi:hypothetical protein
MDLYRPLSVGPDHAADHETDRRQRERQGNEIKHLVATRTSSLGSRPKKLQAIAEQ